MLEQITASITGTQPTLTGVLICTLASFVLGLGIAGLYMVRNRYTKSFALTLALLPAIVQVVIMLVNGNIGAGVAVAGAFSLIRFRSVPGSARDIVSIFFAMAIGLATGMGYVLYAAVFFALIGLVYLLLCGTRFAEGRQEPRILRITIPETMDYEGVFDEAFKEYTKSAELIRVRTTNMGSLYELSYQIELNAPTVPKAFLDALRARNGNLNIVCGRPAAVGKEEMQL